MGCGLSKEEQELRARNTEIDIQLKNDQKKEQDIVKMLLLGGGESGKSTILKQMKLIHTDGYSEAEKVSFKEIIFSNIIQSMKSILEAMPQLGISLANSDLEKNKRSILDMPLHLEGTVFPPECKADIDILWTDSGVQACYARSPEYQLNDSAKYYFDALDRVCQKNYLPTEQDILRSRVKTTCIIENDFHIGDLTYKLYDVGGQRSERRKWIHCFENVTAILFMVAISEYDQALYEDRTVNRLTESCALFESICNSKWFIKSSMILFLNKKDLFAQKIKVSPLEKYCPEYPGGDDYDAASEFMSNKFSTLNTTEDKEVYIHFTCATDTDQIKLVMEAVYDTVVQANLRICGLA